ncbi:MAG: hypothetical protein AAF907_04425 [Planctomycetota bacterium]
MKTHGGSPPPAPSNRDARMRLLSFPLRRPAPLGRFGSFVRTFSVAAALSGSTSLVSAQDVSPISLFEEPAARATVVAAFDSPGPPAPAPQAAPLPGTEPPFEAAPAPVPPFEIPRLAEPGYGAPLPAPPGDAEVPMFAEPPEFGDAGVPGPPRPAVQSPPGAPFFADTEYGARPNLGHPCAPSAGSPHRMEQSNRYGIWYRPKSFNAPNRAVYRPSPFRPRGFGNLFDRPCVTDRMDYTPYSVRDLPSRYGPTYFPHFRKNTECLVRPTRHYDKGPHAENATGGCRLGSDCFLHQGLGNGAGAGFPSAGWHGGAGVHGVSPAAHGGQCENCSPRY